VAWFISLPFNIRLALLFVFGLVVGGQINRAIYGLAWDSRPIGPWTTKHKDAPQRSWWDRLPIVGWFGLAREEKVHGKLYWFRPMLIELAMGIGFAMLYQFEMDGGLHEWVIPEGRVPTPPVAAADLHWEYLSHIVLITLMMVATFIDFDEKTIPDTITVPGTMIGFLIATIAPSSLLPSFFVTGAAPNFKVTEPFLDAANPFLWVPVWDGVRGLLVAILCLLGWWYALAPKTFYFRRGFTKGLKFLVARMFRKPRYQSNAMVSPSVLSAAFVVSLVWTLIAWYWGGTHWRGLLSSLVGMAFGGGLVWAFRVVASTVMQQEALGFGDVTLMGMIGAYVGWQPSLLIFFIAPFAGMLIALCQLVITRRKEIAYGPYLCFGTLVLILNWTTIWVRTQEYYLLGLWIPVGLFICLIALGVMLGSWLWFKHKFIYPDED
jgi:prepilin signal peptidase PulO-like enzyme (type II secretory pathway)